jgi:hypothetical protein
VSAIRHDFDLDIRVSEPVGRAESGIPSKPTINTSLIATENSGCVKEPPTWTR